MSWVDSRMSVHLLASLLLLISLQRMSVSQLMMDMALHSFDDQYLGCREQVMEELERGDYFHKEIAANKNYFSLWKKAQEALLKSPVGLLREMQESHAIVLMAYTMNSSLHSQLNWATSTAGSSPEQYRHNFSFKYFHFYLTTAIQIVKQWQSSKENMRKHKCYRVHRGVKDLHIEAMVGRRVRFGRFTSTSRLWNEAQKFGNETLFTVTTCLGAALQGFSYYTSEKEVLIPPYEVFVVKNFFRTEYGNRLHLHSVGNFSKYHCQLLEASTYPIYHCKDVAGYMCWDPSIPIAMADEICRQPEFRYYSGGLQGSYTAGLRITLDFDPPLFWQAQLQESRTVVLLPLPLLFFLV